MPIYAVTYVYEATEEHKSEIRPTHREWLAEQLAEGTLLASGPWVDSAGALLIWRAESQDHLAALLDHDPFDIAGVISERTIKEWNPIQGPWG